MGIEPTRVIHSLDFESSASTSSATLAWLRVVREKGIEPSRLTAPVPKTGVYTNFTTLAFQANNIRGFYSNKNYLRRKFCCVYCYPLAKSSLPQQIYPLFYSFEPMPSHLHRVAGVLSWLISPVMVAPTAYSAIVMFGFGNNPNRISFVMVLLFASTLVPVLLISGLKKTGKISDYNITFREQRFFPLLALVGVNALGYELMQQLAAPRLLGGILLFNALNMVFILLVTLQWKISIHLFTLASSIALLFVQFGSITLWLLFLVPILMWSRIVLKAHNLMQTLVGGVVGFVVTFAELTWWTGL